MQYFYVREPDRERIDEARGLPPRRPERSGAVADGSTPEKRTAIPEATRAALCAPELAVRAIDAAQISAAAKLRVAADVKAAPPVGIEGLDLRADATDRRPQQLAHPVCYAPLTAFACVS